MKYHSPRLSGHRNYPNLRKEKGAVAILVALSMVVLLGMVGLAVDSGKLFVSKSELQNSADACALAAARELTGANTNQLTLAAAAGITTGNLHKVVFQGNQVSVSAVDGVQFSDALAGPYQAAFVGTGALTMQYALCTVQRTGIANWLIPILNLLPGASVAATQTVNASAVATLGASQTFSCPVPISLCSSAVPVGTTPGKWIKVDLTQNGCGGWAAYQDNTGANAIRDSLTGTCGSTNLPAVGSQVTVPGCKTTLIDAWNTRFGVYTPSYNAPSAPGGNSNMPDLTGYAYYPGWNWGNPATPMPNPPPLAPNVWSDFQAKRSGHNQLQDPTAAEVTASKEPPVKPGSKGFDPAKSPATHLTQNNHTTLGADRRVGVAAIVDCPTVSSGSPVVRWACILMVHPLQDNMPSWVEYRGDANDKDSPCATSGISGGISGAGPQVPVLVR